MVPSQHADTEPTLLRERQTSALTCEHWLNFVAMSNNGLVRGWHHIVRHWVNVKSLYYTN